MGGFGQIHGLGPVRAFMSSNLEDSQVLSGLGSEIASFDLAAMTRSLSAWKRVETAQRTSDSFVFSILG